MLKMNENYRQTLPELDALRYDAVLNLSIEIRYEYEYARDTHADDVTRK